MIALVCAIFGAVVLLIERDDKDQMGIGTAPWTALLVLTASALIWLSGVDLIGFGLSVAAAIWLIAGRHNWCLSGPDQTVVIRDVLQRFLAKLFGRNAGDRMGWKLWAAFGVVRYVMPAALIGYCTHNPWMLGIAPVLMFCYWPISYHFAKGEPTKYLGAVLIGALFFGSLGAGV